MRRILIIEDDSAIGQGLVDAIQWGGYAPEWASTGPAGLRLALESPFDLVLLDLALPGMDGILLLGELRAARPHQAVIILTARGSEADRIRGLQLGADDYVIKPFSMHELLARIEAVLRRVPHQASLPPRLNLPHCSIDFVNHLVLHPDQSTSRLSQRELEILQYLAHHHHRPVAREELLQKIWGLTMAGNSTRTVDMHVARLREKLKHRDDAPSQKVLVTVHGHGYQLLLPNTSSIDPPPQDPPLQDPPQQDPTS